MGEWLRACRNYRQRFWTYAGRTERELWAWARAEQVDRPNVQALREAIAALHIVEPGAVDAEKDTEAPIFILSNGMRSGSTLLQRIVVTDAHVLLWGEPFGDLDVVSSLTKMVTCLVNPWSLEGSEGLNPQSLSLATSWIANFFPSGENFRLAFRALFDRWLGYPAHHLGFARWGFKEIRLGASEAMLLWWLYPRAKFVVLLRHPYDCYRSLADSGWVASVIDGIPIDSAVTFARFWNQRALSWGELPSTFPYLTIKYEDLISGKTDLRAFESWLGLEIKESLALSADIGSTATRPRLSRLERLIIAREAGSGMSAFGYSK